MLHASSIDPVIKQLLSEAVLRVEGGDFLDVPDLGEQLHHVVVVPIGHLKHLLLFVNTDFLKGNMLHLGDGPKFGPSNCDRKAVE